MFESRSHRPSLDRGRRREIDAAVLTSPHSAAASLSPGPVGPVRTEKTETTGRGQRRPPEPGASTGVQTNQIASVSVFLVSRRMRKGDSDGRTRMGWGVGWRIPWHGPIDMFIFFHGSWTANPRVGPSWEDDLSMMEFFFFGGIRVVWHCDDVLFSALPSAPGTPRMLPSAIIR